MEPVAEVATKVHTCRRAPAGVAAQEPTLDMPAVYEYYRTRNTTQNGGEGLSVPADGFTPALLTGTPTFFGNRLGPYPQRAYWALREKGLLEDGTVRYVHGDLFETKPAWYQEHVYSKGTYPSLAVDGTVIGESAIVLEYLEDRWPERTRIMPDCPLQRAAVRFLFKTFDAGLGVLYDVLTNAEPADDVSKVAVAVAFLKTIEALFAKQSGGPYFLGAALSIADIAVVPFLERFLILLPFYRGCELMDLGGCVRLRACRDACVARPAFAASFPPAEFIVASYLSFACREKPTGATAAAISASL